MLQSLSSKKKTCIRIRSKLRFSGSKLSKKNRKDNTHSKWRRNVKEKRLEKPRRELRNLQHSRLKSNSTLLKKESLFKMSTSKRYWRLMAMI